MLKKKMRRLAVWQLLLGSTAEPDGPFGMELPRPWVNFYGAFTH